jgi:hypothetical protein
MAAFRVQVRSWHRRFSEVLTLVCFCANDGQLVEIRSRRRKIHMKTVMMRRTVLSVLALGALVFTSSVSTPAQACGNSDVFTVAVISDTQNYVDYTFAQPESFQPFLQETRFLARHQDELNLAFVTQVGDVVQHGDGTNGAAGDTTYGAGAEWDLATQAMSILARTGVPFGMTPGNHDYDNYSYTTGNRPLVSEGMWTSYFGSHSSFFGGKGWYGGASDRQQHSPGLSSYQLFEAGNRLFLHISLELEAGDAALGWAQRVIDQHPGYATIVTTHEFLNPPADTDASLPLTVPAERIATSSYLDGSPAGWNSAQGIWDKFISKNDQIFMVVCGHASGSTVNGVSKSENVRIDKNQAGHDVYQVLTDFQNNKVDSTGGDGWLRFMEFDMHRNQIHFSTYSPTLDKWAGYEGENTFNQAPQFSDFVLPMPTQVLMARFGHHPIVRHPEFHWFSMTHHHCGW